MPKLLILVRTHWLAITLLNLLAITTLSLWPVEYLPDAPGSDKTHHLIAYALLMFPAALAKPKYGLLLGLLCIGWSGAIELIQPYVNRYAEWLDMAANGVGVALGYSLAGLLHRFMGDRITLNPKADNNAGS
ncbi:MAG: hypothetical protein V7629_15365 [Motiliproteus sp.]